MRPWTLNLDGWRAALLLVSACLALEASGRIEKRNTAFCKNRENGRYKNPTDCTKYYRCDDNNRFWEMPCGPGTHFNEKKGICDHIENANCSPSTTVARDVMTSTTATTNTNTNNNNNNNNNNDNDTNRMADNKCQRIVCYYINWGPQKPNDVDGTKCTHIIYAYAVLFANKITTRGIWWEEEERYKAMVAKKNSNPNLKVLLSVAGYNLRSKPITEIVRNKTNREYFIETSIDYLKKHNFDGLDLGWAYPTTGEIPQEDRRRFTSLLQELRSAFDEEGAKTWKSPLLLTVAVAPKNSILSDAANDIPKLDMYVDFINLLSWDFHRPREGKTGHHSPLYSLTKEFDDMLNVNYTAEHWIKAGASENKLVIGIPLFARHFTMKSTTCIDCVGVPSAVYGGKLTYSQVCDLLKKNGVSKRRIPNQQVPYFLDGKIWVGYDDAESIANKVKFVLSKKYGGVVVWELGQDDYKGTSCGQGRYPLMTKINQLCRTTT